MLTAVGDSAIEQYDAIQPRYSSQKVFIKSHFEYCPPGLFVLSMNEESVYRILSVCEAGSDEIPENLQVNTSNTDLHQQVVKVNIFSFTNNFAHPPSPLRQRSVSRVEEIVQTKLVRYISNSDILSICFVFHPEKSIWRI